MSDRPACRDGRPEWTIYITNDNCPDYTWGFAEDQTRRAMADIVAAHLDLMAQTDSDPPENRNRYNAAVTQEVLCFLQHYPGRRDELVARVREGRLFISPFLCNTLWGLQSAEGALRSLMPARRLAREWGVPIDVAEHIELPSLPWGMPTLLTGCGIRWLSLPFLNYDCTFSLLQVPPLFAHEGPDGSRINVILDRWASMQSNYTQGAALLRDPSRIPDWVAHYRDLGPGYPGRAILASGTHGDLSPHSGAQAPEFAQAIRAYNAQPARAAALVNATLPAFCHAVDAAAPTLPVARGCFGHSWELWTVSLASYAAAMRDHERLFAAAEALAATALDRSPHLADQTRANRERAEWCWAMLGDHAWNGTDPDNQRVNAELRRTWCQDFGRLSRLLCDQAWQALGVAADDGFVLFNPTAPRPALVAVEVESDGVAVWDAERELPSQVVQEDGASRLYFTVPDMQGWGFRQMRFGPRAASPPRTPLSAEPGRLCGPFYELTADPATGAIGRLLHRPTGIELLAGERSLAETTYFDGQECAARGETVEVVAAGPVLARLRMTASIKDIRLTTFATIYADLDRVDLDLRVEKPVTDAQQRLCHLFPVLADGDVLRVETPAAVVIPRPQPEGDLLPGADPSRIAVQGFVDIARSGPGGVRIAPLDAFALRLDLGGVTFEALGNDQNYREVVRDQHGISSFRFRYALSAYAGPYDQAAAVAWARAVAAPVLTTRGQAPGLPSPLLSVNPARAVVTCLKPADDPTAGGVVVRLWETAGRSDPIVLEVPRFRRAFLTDLLETDQRELQITDGRLAVDVRPLGLVAVRLMK